MYFASGRRIPSGTCICLTEFSLPINAMKNFSLCFAEYSIVLILLKIHTYITKYYASFTLVS